MLEKREAWRNFRSQHNEVRQKYLYLVGEQLVYICS